MRPLILLAAVAFAAPDREDPTPKENRPPQERVLGDWRIANGPNDNVLRVLRIERGKMLILVDGIPWPNDAFSGDVAFDWTVSPATFDYTAKQYRGILKFDGELLLVNLALGGERPANFDQNGRGHVLKLARMKR